MVGYYIVMFFAICFCTGFLMVPLEGVLGAENCPNILATLTYIIYIAWCIWFNKTEKGKAKREEVKAKMEANRIKRLEELKIKESLKRNELELKKKSIEEMVASDVYNTGLQTVERKKMTNNLRKFILERDDYTCQVCGASLHNDFNLKLEVDHIVPISKGGKTDPSNLQTLCRKCNRSKGAKPMEVFVGGK